MALNPEGFQFQTLSTHFKDPSKAAKKGPPRQPATPSRGGSKKNLNSSSRKSKEQQDAENDIGSYANLIYGTIKNFFSGIVEIKGNDDGRHQNHFRVRKPGLQNPAQFVDDPSPSRSPLSEHAQHPQNQKRDRAEKRITVANRGVQADPLRRTQPDPQQPAAQNHSLFLREFGQSKPKRVLQPTQPQDLLQPREHDSGRHGDFQGCVPDTADPHQYRPDRVRICRAVANVRTTYPTTPTPRKRPSGTTSTWRASS